METNEQAPPQDVPQPQRGAVPVKVYMESDEPGQEEAPDVEPEATEQDAAPEETEAAPEEAVVEETEASTEEAPAEEETTEEQPADAPAETQAAEEPPAPAPVDQRMVRHANFGAQMEQLLNQDPEVRKAYLRSLQRQGVALPPEELRFLEEKPAAPAAPTKTYEEVRKEAQALILRGEELQAQELIADWRIQQLFKEHIEPFKNEAATMRKAEQSRAAAAQQAEEDRALRNECLELAKKYPSLAEPDPKQPWGVKWKDMAFYEELIKVSRNVSHSQALPILAEVVLARQGKLAQVQPKGKVAPKPAGKPPLKPSPRPAVRAAAPQNQRGMVSVPVTIIE